MDRKEENVMKIILKIYNTYSFSNNDFVKIAAIK